MVAGIAAFFTESLLVEPGIVSMPGEEGTGVVDDECLVDVDGNCDDGNMLVLMIRRSLLLRERGPILVDQLHINP